MRSNPSDRPGIYFAKDKTSGLIKVGKAADLDKRVAQLRAMNAGEIEVLVVWPCEASARLEELIHRVLDGTRHHGEWFKPSALLTRIVARTQAGRLDTMRVLRPRYATLEDARDAVLGIEAAADRARA